MIEYTIFAVFEENPDRRYSTTVTAESPEDAEKKAIAEAPATIKVAGVFSGVVESLCLRRETIPTIHGTRYETGVSLVTVRHQTIRLPIKCPQCETDLRNPESVRQWDYWDYYWEGRIPRGVFKGDYGIAVNHDKGVRAGNGYETTIVAVVLQCSKCEYELWNGYREES